MDNVHQNDGANSFWLPLPLTVCALPYQNNHTGSHFVFALPIFHNLLSNTWLVLESHRERCILRLTEDVIFMINALWI